MIEHEIDKEYQVDPESIQISEDGLIGKTFDGRQAVLITSASVLLYAEFLSKQNEAKKLGRSITTLPSGIHLEGDVGPAKVRQTIEFMIGKTPLLPKGHEYVLGPIFGTVSPEAVDYFEMKADWGIYRIKGKSMRT